MNKRQIMSDVDTIDHITIHYRKNRPVDREKAIRTIKHCKAFYADLFTYGVEDSERLAKASVEELVAELIETREKMMAAVFEEGSAV